MSEADLKLLIVDLVIEARTARLQLAAAQARIAEIEKPAPVPEPSSPATFDDHGQATP